MSLSLNGSEFIAPSAFVTVGPNPGNTFTLMPIKALGHVEAGHSVPANLATYQDPLVSARRKARVEQLPYWQQSMELSVDEVEEAFFLPDGARAQLGHWELEIPRLDHNLQADKAFKGRVALNGISMAAHGIAHPRIPGWVKLDAEMTQPMRTIADLKAHLGRIPLQVAYNANHRWNLTETFSIRDREFR